MTGDAVGEATRPVVDDLDDVSFPDMTLCESSRCGSLAEPAHAPCCSAHGRALCCSHYCRFHHVEVEPCSPSTHGSPT